MTAANPIQCLTIITPAYNEAKNLPVLYQAIQDAMASVEGYTWEWVLVDDHSRDETFRIFSEMAAADPRLRGVRFSRNNGSHKALTCGFREARGDCAVILAADLQDPPATIPALLEQREAGAQIVWAVRAERKGAGPIGQFFSNRYYWIMRKVVGLDMPSTGADFFLLDRAVLDALKLYNESNVSIMALLSSMGFRQSNIKYVKEARLHGSTGWTLAKKLKLFVDSVTAFTYAPIRWMVYAGFTIGFLGFLYGAVIVHNYLMGSPVQGWSSLMVVILFLGGVQMMMLGVLGEYTWRALDESRARPIYLIEARTSRADPTSE